MIDQDFLIRLQDELHLDLIDARIQKYNHELIVYDNGVVRDFTTSIVQGVGVRVVYNGHVAYSSTNNLEKDAIKEAVVRAYKLARAASKYMLRIDFYKRPVIKDNVESHYIIDPEYLDYSEKV
ncbi:MAG: DNA gyrase modulator, partial [Ignisphaera sp.]